ncbi:accessory Sec system translocase SecA2 [Paenisporosarcina cavernae]|uniref:Protein translocase subunit SecA n=1 Tax=Paenisporosarcina cavernae TaxID=2320858 RepID=A0A385YTB7_9BACL|nr:accessory Sec system translocase SecA2 [Paenisporosarcina cavernae]AYC28928.1 accessory Sec system translocase SecA2 [Paenisporosarcina cavernae]
MVSLFKRSNQTSERELKKYRKVVSHINELESTFASLSDEELKDMTFIFRDRLEKGEKLEALIPEAFAVVREASKRVLNKRHFDVQLIGGLVLSEGNIAEMPTGEGKTLVASLPSYLRALTGKGVHVITVNDYLAERDFNEIGQIHRFLGLTVGLNVSMLTPSQKQAAYRADITYGVGTEFGFDYLRDNMSPSRDNQVQRPYHFAIIDEVDSVLIDEAKTPLIVAGKAQANASLHMIAARLAKRFTIEEDYEMDEETKATSLTDLGIEKVEKAFGVDNLYDLEHQSLYHYVIQAVRAHVMFKRDVDYIVKDDKIMLVDMFTGRIMEGRTLSDGLHQAIEAKEAVTITEENKAQAQVTIQNYFRMYPTLCGMTGTAKTQEREFRDVYGMNVIQVPTNRPKIREDLEDIVYETTEQKYTAVANRVKELHSKGQPVLIGTTSILQTEAVAEYLKKVGLEFQLLNAKSVEQEVYLISQAGQLNQITVATNMAGRGTDIVLGEGVADVGGLYVVGTEKHENRRIDNQLRGRSGRQGDPGTSQFLISLEDEMFTRYAKEELEKFNKKVQLNELGIVQNKEVKELTDRTQRIVEGAHASMREYNLKLDDVINDQRSVIYTLRDRVLDRDDLMSLLITMLDETVEHAIGEATPAELAAPEWDFARIESTIMSLTTTKFELDRSFDKVKLIEKEVAQPIETLKEFMRQFETNDRVMATIPKVMVSYIDSMWVRHLEAMSRLKEGIGLRQYQQEDPMRIYQREGLEMFAMHYQELRRSIAKEIIGFMKMINKQEEDTSNGSV